MVIDLAVNFSLKCIIIRKKDSSSTFFTYLHIQHFAVLLGINRLIFMISGRTVHASKIDIGSSATLYKEKFQFFEILMNQKSKYHDNPLSECPGFGWDGVHILVRSLDLV